MQVARDQADGPLVLSKYDDFLWQWLTLPGTIGMIKELGNQTSIVASGEILSSPAILPTPVSRGKENLNKTLPSSVLGSAINSLGTSQKGWKSQTIGTTNPIREKTWIKDNNEGDRLDPIPKGIFNIKWILCTCAQMPMIIYLSSIDVLLHPQLCAKWG